MASKATQCLGCWMTTAVGIMSADCLHMAPAGRSR
jgi:hypothetical protein